MLFSSVLDSSIKSSADLVLLCYFDRRELLPFPKTYKDAEDLARQVFGLGEGKLQLKTQSLDVCQGESVVINRLAWEALRPVLSTVEVKLEDNNDEVDIHSRIVPDNGRASGSKTRSYGGESSNSEREDFVLVGTSNQLKGKGRSQNARHELNPDQEVYPISAKTVNERPPKSVGVMAKEGSVNAVGSSGTVQDDEREATPERELEPLKYSLSINGVSGMAENDEHEAAPEQELEPLETPKRRHNENYQPAHLDVEPQAKAQDRPVKIKREKMPGTPERYVSGSVSGDGNLDDGSSDAEIDDHLLRIKQEWPDWVRTPKASGSKLGPQDESVNDGHKDIPDQSQSQSQQEGGSISREKFLVTITHSPSHRESAFRISGDFLVSKVLKKACKTFELDFKSANLILLIEEEEDGETIEHRFLCDQEDTMARAGAKDESKFIVQGGDNDHDEELEQEEE